MFGTSPEVESILEGLCQPEWRIPLDMIQSQTLRTEIVRLRAKLVDAHRHCCTPENCVLDGGPEHAAAFLAKGEVGDG